MHKNNEIFKIVYLPQESEIIFNAKYETPVSLHSDLYSKLLTHIDINEWKCLYEKAYRDWLNDVSDAVCNIHDPVNMLMIAALIQLNETLPDRRLYYWFDVDRTYNEGFTWKYCPISGKELILLGDGYPKKNYFISPEYPLVFPIYEDC
ncbi:hypothetical protein [Chitinophaga sp.]|uniref:hypothetical protein n=1 Tax=Chitinophaga sp. TaxID=1869181 RepID=UPI002F93D596